MRLKKLIKFALLAAMAAGFIWSRPTAVEAAQWVQTDSGEWTYVDNDGNPYCKRWLYEGGWYYFDENGKMVKGLVTITSSVGTTHTYYFNPTLTGSYKEGRMMTGWQYINGKYMYFNSNGEYVESGTSSIGSLKGIDVSQYQGNMDWKKVAEQGISFAFVRVGHGDHSLDPYYKKNMKAAAENGIKTGVYFYSTATSTSQAKSDAQWVIDQLQGYNISYPVALDMEDNSQISLGKQAITNMVKVFCNEIESAGYTPMIYCNENWAKNYIDFSQLDGIYKWIARYNGTYNENIKRDIWQAGSTTLLEGITVNSVDIDFGYTDFTTIVTPRTEHLDTYVKHTGMWVLGTGGWWYDNGDGTYPASQWFFDEMKYYYFNSQGYLQTGWIKYNDYWYYSTENGILENTWLQYNGTWYYFNSDGVMITGWMKIKDKWYYFDASGAMITGWMKINDKWYYFDTSGAMAADTTIDGYKLNANGEWEE